ncbi:hypothetical protein BDW62DRAFT_193636 [Aspergillus aurantiobrunneus]
MTVHIVSPITMDADPTFQEDLELFGRFMRVVNAVQPHPIRSVPFVDSESQTWRPDIESEDTVLDELNEPTEDEDGSFETDNDEGDGDIDEDQYVGDDDGEEDSLDNEDVCNDHDSTGNAVTNPSAQNETPQAPTSAKPLPKKRREASDDADLPWWDHGCNGSKFTTRSNLRRHIAEKARRLPACQCPRCGVSFTRTTARNTHLARGSRNRIRRYSSGRGKPIGKINES